MTASSRISTTSRQRRTVKLEAQILGDPGRVEGDAAVAVTQTGHTVNDSHPCAADRGNMGAVLEVAAHIGQIHQQRENEVTKRDVLVTDLRGDDALDARRQR